MLVLFVCAMSLSAQITQEHADTLVLEYIQNRITPPYILYLNANTPSAEDFVITTANEETCKAKYACWVYYLDENPDVSEPARQRYFFVKENNGHLLKVITRNDFGISDLSQWIVVANTTPEFSDATLASLNVSTGELVPVFSSDNVNYTLNVMEAEEITIMATPTISGARVSGTGTFPLETGQNTFTVNVVAKNGETEVDYTIVINNSVGINELESSFVKIYPNPTTGELRIDNGELRIDNVEFFDVFGRKQKSTIVNLQSEILIDISYLPAGVYFIKLSSQTETITQKIMKN